MQSRNSGKEHFNPAEVTEADRLPIDTGNFGVMEAMMSHIGRSPDLPGEPSSSAPRPTRKQVLVKVPHYHA